MQFKFRDILIFTFFGLNLIVILLFSRFAFVQLKESSLERTKEQLTSINMLKKKHIEYYLENKVREIQDFVRYADHRQYDDRMLLSMLLDAGEVKGAAIRRNDIITASPELIEEFLTSKSIGTFSDTISVHLNDITVNDLAMLHVIVYHHETEIHVFFNKKGLIDIVLERSGMGATGESYFVDSDFRMLSPSRFFPDSIPETIPVKTKGVQMAFKGESGVDVYPDYRGVMIIGAYRLLEYHNLNFCLLTEIDYEEAMQSINRIRDFIIFITLILIVVNLTISILAAQLITKPVSRLKEKAVAMSKGIIPQKLIDSSKIREIHEISHSINRLIDSISHTVSFSREIGRENFNISYNLLSEEDELGKAVMEMRNKLIILNQQKSQLETQRKKDLINTQEAERERISRDIHDGIGPLLTTTKMKISSLAMDEKTKAELLELINNTINEIRNASKNLMPGVLLDFGPAEAIKAMVDEIKQKTDFDIVYHVEKSTELTNFGKEKGIALFRIAQEAINNALKHSGGTKIIVSFTEFDEFISLYIKDNGRGFNKNIMNTSGGKGLRNIEERVNILGGELHINSDSDGTIIEIEIPRDDE